jgi:hypothetical protein
MIREEMVFVGVISHSEQMDLILAGCTAVLSLRCNVYHMLIILAKLMI